MSNLPVSDDTIKTGVQTFLDATMLTMAIPSSTHKNGWTNVSYYIFKRI